MLINKWVIILGILLVFELYLRPRLIYTRDAGLLLWYGRKNRKYLVIF